MAEGGDQRSDGRDGGRLEEPPRESAPLHDRGVTGAGSGGRIT